MASASRGALAALGALAAAGAASAVWGIGIERQLFTVRRHVVRMLEPGSTPIRILHISDAHMAPWQHRKQRWMARLAALRPDLVVSTGDALGHSEGLAGVRAALSPLRGVPGVYVHGSNDLWGPGPRNPFRYFRGPSERTPKAVRLDTEALDAFLTDDLGWSSVDNGAATLSVRGGEVRVFGVGDAHHGLDDVPASLDALASQPDAPLTFGVMHAPYRRVLDDFTDAGADFLFAGHTHGGQVRVPFYGALVANCDIPLRQARGLSTWTHRGRITPLNVSAGLGHSIYAPVRFACRPEASLITLAPRA
ncbi:metallophosphoesterase [Microbacterium marinilacus]|uniref:Metallophosphoesterase n=1 Tax=Microbacterium marinilacus TaxID=415209 RepID=A0ABP7BF41_9MICO|nr:metallophosphoesterase [Microbacterium marinilacus]MBY0689037.1 metallophosphoesterase [Microbacterium marinilacus]